jgi:hypothetical protein
VTETREHLDLLIEAVVRDDEVADRGLEEDPRIEVARVQEVLPGERVEVRRGVALEDLVRAGPVCSVERDLELDAREEPRGPVRRAVLDRADLELDEPVRANATDVPEDRRLLRPVLGPRVC